MVVGDVAIGTDVLIIGGGPAGFSAAMSCAKNGLDVTFVFDEIGGSPLLYAGYLLDSLKRYGKYNPGHAFDVTHARRLKDMEWKMARLKDAGVQIVKGKCSFLSSSKAVASDFSGRQDIEFKRAVIATGIRYIDKDGTYPGEIFISKKLPEEATVKGNGADAVAMATILSASGSKVRLEYGEKLLPGIDSDVVSAILASLNKDGTQASDKGKVIIAGKTAAAVYGLGLDHTGVKLRDGFIEVDAGYRTTDPAIYAIGSVTGITDPGLAFRDGKSLANILRGDQGLIRPEFVPVVLYSDPPSASVGMSDTASGVETIAGRADFRGGFVKVVAEKATERLLGVHCMSEDAHGLIAEATLALEMGARLEDILLTVHPYNESFNAFMEACAIARLPGKGPIG